MKVLLTGFEPFGGETINPSWEVAKRVSSEGVEGAEIVTALLPTVFGKSINEAVRVIEELKPDLVISLGQAGGSAEITVERWGCGRFFGLDYAARPRLRRYSIGLIASKDILIRSSLYQRRKPSSSYMNSSRETPSQDLV
jgi:hypothetical protein